MTTKTTLAELRAEVEKALKGEEKYRGSIIKDADEMFPDDRKKADEALSDDVEFWKAETTVLNYRWFLERIAAKEKAEGT